jgi:hypothetical protein
MAEEKQSQPSNLSVSVSAAENPSQSVPSSASINDFLPPAFTLTLCPAPAAHLDINLPCSCWDCLATLFYIHFSGLDHIQHIQRAEYSLCIQSSIYPYTHQVDTLDSNIALPAVRFDRNLAAGSARNVIEYLAQNHADLDEYRSLPEKSEISAYISLISTELRLCLDYFLYAEQNNYSAVGRQLHASQVSAPVRAYLRWKNRREKLQQLHSANIKTAADAVGRATAIFTALNNRLHNEPRFFGLTKNYSSLDCVLAGFVVFQQAINLPFNPLNELLERDFHSLLAHAQLIYSKFTVSFNLHLEKATNYSFSATNFSVLALPTPKQGSKVAELTEHYEKLAEINKKDAERDQKGTEGPITRKFPDRSAELALISVDGYNSAGEREEIPLQQRALRQIKRNKVLLLFGVALVGFYAMIQRDKAANQVQRAT